VDWRIKLRVAWKELSNDRIPMYIFTSDTTQSLDKFSFLGRGEVPMGACRRIIRSAFYVKLLNVDVCNVLSN